MNTSMLHDGGPAIADAVRDASKAVGSMIQAPVQKLHVPHVSLPHLSGHLPAVHLPRKRRRRKSRGLAMIGVVAILVACIAMLRRRKDDSTQLA